MTRSDKAGLFLRPVFWRVARSAVGIRKATTVAGGFRDAAIRSSKTFPESGFALPLWTAERSSAPCVLRFLYHQSASSDSFSNFGTTFVFLIAFSFCFHSGSAIPGSACLFRVIGLRVPPIVHECLRIGSTGRKCCHGSQPSGRKSKGRPLKYQFPAKVIHLDISTAKQPKQARREAGKNAYRVPMYTDAAQRPRVQRNARTTPAAPTGPLRTPDAILAASPLPKHLRSKVQDRLQ